MVTTMIPDKHERKSRRQRRMAAGRSGGIFELVEAQGVGMDTYWYRYVSPDRAGLSTGTGTGSSGEEKGVDMVDMVGDEAEGQGGDGIYRCFSSPTVKSGNAVGLSPFECGRETSIAGNGGGSNDNMSTTQKAAEVKTIDEMNRLVSRFRPHDRKTNAEQIRLVTAEDDDDDENTPDTPGSWIHCSLSLSLSLPESPVKAQLALDTDDDTHTQQDEANMGFFTPWHLPENFEIPDSDIFD